MALVDQLLEIDKQLWTEGAELYQRHVDDECLVAFGEHASVMTRDEVAATVGNGPRWEEPQIQVRGLVEPKKGFAVLTYEATARRADDNAPYVALVSSGYVKRGRSWKLAFHQQTPIH
jgi:hypothetical protein